MEADKIIKGMKMCISPGECSPDDCPYYDRPRNESGLCWDRLMTDAIALLKWQEEREKAICKGICDFIRGSCSTDTYEDKEYVCHVIQQMFIKGRSAK